MLSTHILGGYSQYHQKALSTKMAITFKTWSITALLLIFLAFLFQDSIHFSRRVVITWFIITPFLTLGLKILSKNFFKLKKHSPIKILFIGNAYRLNEHESSHLKRQQIILKTVDTTADNFEAFQNSVSKIVHKFQPNYIVFNLPEQVSPALIKYLTALELEGNNFLSVNNFMESFLRKCYIPFDGHNLDYLNDIKPYSPMNSLSKHIIDLLAVFSLIILTGPVMVYAAFKIKSQSPGNIIFRQLRVGKGKKEFYLNKFRSMHLDAEKNGAQYAQKDDPRTYEFGATMRKTRIDELPQLWNILTGDLHLIGPRPERKIFTDDLEKEIPYYHERHIVKPGISGWAQVMYPYGANTEDARQKLMYDLYYIKHWSIWLEIETIIRTILVMVSKKGM